MFIKMWREARGWSKTKRKKFDKEEEKNSYLVSR